MGESARIAHDPGERGYHREMIATYVFAKRGDVRSPIPAPLSGPLVPMSPSARAALRQQLHRLVQILLTLPQGKTR